MPVPIRKWEPFLFQNLLISFFSFFFFSSLEGWGGIGRDRSLRWVAGTQVLGPWEENSQRCLLEMVSPQGGRQVFCSPWLSCTPGATEASLLSSFQPLSWPLLTTVTASQPQVLLSCIMTSREVPECTVRREVGGLSSGSYK